MSTYRAIQGSGGGGGGGKGGGGGQAYVPTEADDSLQSVQYGSVLDLLSEGEIEGIERVRFTSPHPKDFTDDVIEAMSETKNIMPQLHMPLQSGSDDVLKAMRRSYRRDKYLGIIKRVREVIPDAAITTDVIVGFPGESEADFEQTLDLIREVRFANVFTFIYSIRPGTPAAEMENQIPEQLKQARYERLAKEVNQIVWEENQARIGTIVEVLVAAGEGKKDKATGRLSGRAKDNRLVHFIPDEDTQTGDIVQVEITDAAPFHLISDKPILHSRKTLASQLINQTSSSAVSLGMPQVMSQS